MAVQFGNYQLLQNTGYQKFGENNLGTPLKVILVPINTQVAATAALAATQATYTALIKGSKPNRILPLPLAVEYKYDGQADKFQDRPFSGKKFVYEGKDGFDLMLNIDQSLHKKLRKLNFRNYDVILVDTNRNILGTSPDGTTFYGFKTTDVHLGKIGWNDGSKAAETTLSIHLSNPAQWNDFGVYIDGKELSWDPNQLDGVYDCNLVCTSPSASGFKVSVNYDGLPTTEPDSQVTGLVKADFIVTGATGGALSLSAGTCTDNGDGTYTFTGLTISNDTYTVTLVACASISVTTYQIEAYTPGTFVKS